MVLAYYCLYIIVALLCLGLHVKGAHRLVEVRLFCVNTFCLIVLCCYVIVKLLLLSCLHALFIVDFVFRSKSAFSW